jgi:hypothetical protein
VTGRRSCWPPAAIQSWRAALARAKVAPSDDFADSADGPIATGGSSLDYS